MTDKPSMWRRIKHTESYHPWSIRGYRKRRLREQTVQNDSTAKRIKTFFMEQAANKQSYTQHRHPQHHRRQCVASLWGNEGGLGVLASGILNHSVKRSASAVSQRFSVRPQYHSGHKNLLTILDYLINLWQTFFNLKIITLLKCS